mmetsp:Transcript_41253/g.68929  ORF Transcript_41253/g.68929 Transcript_41253/m.68929 type:complete len:554 (+) Transcript_41253:85-1746(+)
MAEELLEDPKGASSVPSLEQLCVSQVVDKVLYSLAMEEPPNIHKLRTIIQALPQNSANDIFMTMTSKYRYARLHNWEILRMFLARQDISTLHLKSLNGRCPLSSKELQLALEYCSELRSLKLCQARCVDDRVLTAIETKHLETLHLSLCQNVTREGVKAILRRCSSMPKESEEGGKNRNETKEMERRGVDLEEASVQYEGETEETTGSNDGSRCISTHISRMRKCNTSAHTSSPSSSSIPPAPSYRPLQTHPPSSLTSLSLSGCTKVLRGNVKTVNALLSLLPSTLRHLGLSGAKLRPSSQDLLFKSLSCLLSLDIANTRLESVAYSLSSLTNLTRLELQHNNLEVLNGQAIITLSNLSYLDLSGNKIVRLPKEIVNLHSLRILKLKANRLTALDQDLGKLQNLEYLDVSFNRLHELPGTLEACNRLTDVKCSYNNMKGIPLWLLRRRVAFRRRVKGKANHGVGGDGSGENGDKAQKKKTLVGKNEEKNRINNRCEKPEVVGAGELRASENKSRSKGGEHKQGRNEHGIDRSDNGNRPRRSIKVEDMLEDEYT